MLQIDNIRKVYTTGGLVQQALCGVSLCLRDNEFVAILGPSGSGKTTLLNIIGGLDRYDEGDLIINGVSTKKYSDRDWDSYRNHTVGFVFQSYNLIPHQSVLRNVELALTIGGISSQERTARATEALEKVGLREHIHKKPSQLSGGQMQRVAIARALVNDPDILLADEPTGALDSDTSLQVMDLLKEVASDRLVVMVTHNPELAERYATRTVTLMDGKITSDSDPYAPDAGEAVHKNLGRASMSLLTALSLSFNNLWTKKARTILVAFAGSIGIIGIAMILAMSHGANKYIRDVEEESLQSYPLQITDTSFNLMSMYAENAGYAAQAEKDAETKDVEEWRTITTMLSGVNTNDLSSLRAYFESGKCDIYDYVQALEYSYNVSPQIYKVNDDGYRQVNPDKSFTALGFSGTENSTNGLLSTFSNTDSFFPLPEKEELYTTGFDLKAGSWPKDYNECVVVLSVHGRVSDMTLYTLGLKDPDELDEMVKSFSRGDDSDVDTTPTSYDYEDFLGIEFSLVSATDYYTYDKKYKVWSDHSADETYMNDLLKDAETIKVVGVIQPNEDNTSPMINMGLGYHASLTRHIIDVAAESDIVKAQLREPDVNVFSGKRFDDENKAQDPDMSSVFSVDKKAIEEAFNFDPSSGFDMSGFDISGLGFSNIDLGSSLSAKDLSAAFPDLSQAELEALFNSIDFQLTEDAVNELFSQILDGYTAYAADDPRADINNLPGGMYAYLGSDEIRAVLEKEIQNILNARSQELITEQEINAMLDNIMAGYINYVIAHHPDAPLQNYMQEFLASAEGQAVVQAEVDKLRTKLENLTPTLEELTTISAHLAADYESYAEKHDLPSASYLLTSFTEYLKTEQAKSLIQNTVAQATDTKKLEENLKKYTDLLAGGISGVIQTAMQGVAGQLSAAIQSNMAGLMSGMSQNIMSVFKIDPDAFAQLFKMNMTGEELRDLMVSLMSTQETTYETNLKKLGYADYATPASITIYPSDFDSKNHIKAIISDYNRRMEKDGEDDKVIEYSDVVDALMGSVTTIIDAISYVLIAFVAISLVVSSIMIGVITYISVLERRKEIGILRAIGASKHNISQVFNAETFIIGVLAGLIGVGITYILIIPVNAILRSLVAQADIKAILPPAAAAILVALSVVLTLIGGIIPSRKAAKSDPVAALRSE